MLKEEHGKQNKCWFCEDWEKGWKKCRYSVGKQEYLSLPTSSIVVTVKGAVLDNFSLSSPVPFLLFLCFSFTFIPDPQHPACGCCQHSFLSICTHHAFQHLSLSFFTPTIYPNVSNSDCMGTRSTWRPFWIWLSPKCCFRKEILKALILFSLVTSQRHTWMWFLFPLC